MISKMGKVYSKHKAIVFVILSIQLTSFKHPTLLCLFKNTQPITNSIES